jgi:Matrixin
MGCIVEGHDLFRDSPCLSFGIAKGTAASLELSDSELEDIVDHAFERWQSVDCGDGDHPGFIVQSAGIVAADEPHYCELTALNLGVWFLDDPWPITLDSSALGYTTSTYAEDDAQVFDADVEINVPKIQEDFAGVPVEEVLLSIITHEAGHYLGLAHSNDNAAVMATSYNQRDLLGRELTQDDIDGICELYPPNSKLECSAPGVSEAALTRTACDDAIDAETQQDPSCSFEAPTSRGGGPSWLVGAVLFGLGIVRRRGGHTTEPRG